MSTVSRNSLCPCGSNKKFKRCCINKNNPTISTTSNVDLIKRFMTNIHNGIDTLFEFRKNLYKYFKDYSFNETSEVKWVKYYSDVPEISEKIKRVIENVPPVSGECFNYSSLLSSSIEGVNIVYGLMLVSEKTKKEIVKHNPTKGKKNIWFSFQGCRCYIDNENNIWNTHCWNSYKGIQFDCMRDELYENWVNYRKYREKSPTFRCESSKINFRNFTIMDIVTMGNIEFFGYLPTSKQIKLLNW
jgi:hypothetical protein